MTPAEFKAKFGCTPEEYADRLSGKMRAVFERREDKKESERLKRAIASLRDELDHHFKQAVSEGVVKEWTLEIKHDGSCQLRLTAVKEFAPMFRGRGFTVQEE